MPSPIDSLSNMPVYTEALMTASLGSMFPSPRGPSSESNLQFGGGVGHSQQRPLVYGTAPQSELQQARSPQQQHINLNARMASLQLQMQPQASSSASSLSPHPPAHAPLPDPAVSLPVSAPEDDLPMPLMPRSQSSTAVLALADSPDTDAYDANAAVLSPRISGSHGDSRFARMQLSYRKQSTDSNDSR